MTAARYYAEVLSPEFSADFLFYRCADEARYSVEVDLTKAVLELHLGEMQGEPDTVGIMSALGQKRTYAVHKAMSALPPIATAKAEFPQKAMSALHPIADMCGARGHVCFVPKADMTIMARMPPFAALGRSP